MSNKFKLGLFFTNTNRDYNKSAASTWIRIWQMVSTYEKLNIKVDINNPFRRYDAIIVFRKAKRNYYWILKIAKLFSKQVYFDTCINIFEQNSEISSEHLFYAKKIANVSDGIICASHQIARYAQPYAKSVFVMEDPINTNHFSKTKKDINFDDPTFGWSGVGPKSGFLNKYAEVINNKIIIISDNSINNIQLDFNYRYEKWTYEQFPSSILKCDIALLPRDTSCSYNKSHSSFKALVFAASGIPIIANKVPSYVDLSHFYNGIVFLEDNNNNIEACINKLRTRSFDTTRVREHYSCEHQAKILLKYFQSQLSKN